MNASVEMGESEHQAKLRPVVAWVAREIERLRNATAPEVRLGISELLAAWRQLVESLAIGPAPEMRECPACERRGMRAATRCGYCWAPLPALVPVPVAARSDAWPWW